MHHSLQARQRLPILNYAVSQATKYPNATLPPSPHRRGDLFFTVVTYRRRDILCLPEVRRALREAINSTRACRPFRIEGWVLLPDHLHTVWTLPAGDSKFPARWAMIKRHVTKRCGLLVHLDTRTSASKRRRHEATLWQRRYWEHLIRNESDFQRHMDYLHWNPVKHGYVSEVADWPWSTFHRLVKEGLYTEGWGGCVGDGAQAEGFGE